ncbi:MAG: FixH family protein [Bacteroidia bacterium]|jgi:hypothetical protein
MKKFKLNWGYRLMIFTVIFMVFIISMVTFMLRQDIQLVDSDYYEKGIAYQKEIDESKNADKLLRIDYNGGDDASLQLESLLPGYNMIPVSIHFYRPSDKSLDFIDQVFISTGEKMHYSVSKLEKGIWKATFLWSDQSGSHRIENSFTR